MKSQIATRRNRQFREALRSTSGAIDLASIMVGVLVIGIIGGVIAASVFAVIPWSQDEAAKGSLNAVRDAQAVYFTGGDDVTSAAAGSDMTAVTASFAGAAASSGAGKYLNYAGLVEKKLLPASKSVTVLTDDAGTCYVSLSASPTGRVFFGTNKSPIVGEYDAATSGTDFCVTDGQIGDAIQDINLGNTGPGNGGGNTGGGNGGGNTGGGNGGGAGGSGDGSIGSNGSLGFDGSGNPFGVEATSMYVGGGEAYFSYSPDVTSLGYASPEAEPFRSALPVLADVYPGLNEDDFSNSATVSDLSVIVAGKAHKLNSDGWSIYFSGGDDISNRQYGSFSFGKYPGVTEEEQGLLNAAGQQGALQFRVNGGAVNTLWLHGLTNETQQDGADFRSENLTKSTQALAGALFVTDRNVAGVDLSFSGLAHPTINTLPTSAEGQKLTIADVRLTFADGTYVTNAGWTDVNHPGIKRGVFENQSYFGSARWVVDFGGRFPIADGSKVDVAKKLHGAVLTFTVQGDATVYSVKVVRSSAIQVY